MIESRDTTTVILKTSEPNCSGCLRVCGVEGQESFTNPDCAANRVARIEKGLSVEACGLILMQYATENEQTRVYTGKVITPKLTRVLRAIFIEPIGGRWEVYRHDYEARGNSELTIDLKPKLSP